jgi:hypothetical protein
MSSPAPVPPTPARPTPGQDGLSGVESLQETMSAPAAGELVFAVDAARRAGSVARWLMGRKQGQGSALDPQGAERPLDPFLPNSRTR